ncbi:MAG: uroporphyrinogen decarboxylase family protein [Candidatus Heimdallarchaeota archaeon]
MNSRERVKAALYFNKPDKVPVFNTLLGDVLPLILVQSKNWKPGWKEGEENLFPHMKIGYNWDKPAWAKKPEYEGNKWRAIPHEEIDEWGCIWNMKGNDKDQGHPGRVSLPDWEDYDHYFSKYNPDPTDKSRYRLAFELKENGDPDKYRVIVPKYHGPSQLASYIRGFNNYLIDHKRNSTHLKRLLEYIADYHIQVMKFSIDYGLEPHGVWLTDDLGEQSGPFISPKMFELFYESSYKKIFDKAHKLGLDVHLHCCGKIDPLLPILIKWGLNAIELDSPRMCGYPDLRPYRGKIMFWGCVNIQSIYPQGTPEEVERETWHMIRNLGTKDGGFGAWFYDDIKVIKAPRKNVKAFERGLEKFGTYSKIPSNWWEEPFIDEWQDHIVPPLPSSN